MQKDEAWFFVNVKVPVLKLVCLHCGTDNCVFVLVSANL